MGIFDIDFKKVYTILFEEYSIKDVIVFDFAESGFAINNIFEEAIDKMGWNVGTVSSYYLILKLRDYFKRYVTKSYGLAKDPKR